MSLRSTALLVAAGLAGSASAAEPTGITKCQEGAADILGSRKAYTVQVCNLFGATCFVNHPATESDNCATEALSIATGECKLYPIFEFKVTSVRSGDAAVEELSTSGDLACSMSNSNGDYSWSGACVSVQCSLGETTFAGPAVTGTGSGSRGSGITDTSTASFTSLTVGSLPTGAKQLKTVFLSRTGDHVASYKVSSSGSSNGISYKIGALPTSDGNNYGPVACPSRNNLLTSSTADGITAENLRMCGSTGKWTYFNTVNLLMDSSLYSTWSASTGTTNKVTMGSVPFLAGKSGYVSGTAMDDARSATLHSGAAVTTDVMMTGSTVTPKADGAADGETAGTWRSYGAVFYCDDYARTDLTTCANSNRKVFYVADPNPDAQYGSSVLGGRLGTGSASLAKRTFTETSFAVAIGVAACALFM